MELDIAWRKSKRTLLPSGLGWRLLISYLAIFTLLLVAFAIAIHAAFAAVFIRERNERLQTILNVAQSVVDIGTAGPSVDLADETIRAIDPRMAGLRWSNAEGRTVATYGLARWPSARTTIQATSYVKVGDRRNVVVRLDALLSREPYAYSMRMVDLGIVMALMLAIAGSFVAGRWLTRRLVRELDSNMRMLEEFTADAAHELRGPLTALATNSASAMPFRSDAILLSRDAMDSISSATAQMVAVSEDLLTLARANQPLERELFVVDLDESVRKVLLLYREEARRSQVALEACLFEHAQALGNPDQIERIVGNLVQNAIHYTPPGGSVSLSCTRDRAGTRIVVADSGIGIAQEHLERIFDRFWRADPSRSERCSSGLGLTIARGLARRHGGDVTCTSRPGDGSVFTLTLPGRPPRRLGFF